MSHFTNGVDSEFSCEQDPSGQKIPAGSTDFVPGGTGLFFLIKGAAFIPAEDKRRCARSLQRPSTVVTRRGKFARRETVSFPAGWERIF
jgi:hypothetical protein